MGMGGRWRGGGGKRNLQTMPRKDKNEELQCWIFGYNGLAMSR